MRPLDLNGLEAAEGQPDAEARCDRADVRRRPCEGHLAARSTARGKPFMRVL